MIDFNDGVMRILEERYLRSGESPEQMFRRVADEVAGVEGDGAERWSGRFFRAMSRGEFMPNSPTLMNAGTEMNQLSACFALPVPDDMSGIFDALKKSALIFQSGGGTGYSFSMLRPNGDIVHSTDGEASGPVSFMRSFDAMAETVKQGGKRRGAMMGSLSVHHPDIRQFLKAKSEEGSLENFNISVEITDEFIKAVENGEDVELRNPRGGYPGDPSNEMVEGEVDASQILDELAESTWANGEPGILFVDAMNRDYPFSGGYNIITTNPCAELPLEPYGSCNLGHINLAKCVENGRFDREKLSDLVRLGVRFLDNVIEANSYPLEEIAEETRKKRRIGLGVMGWHEALLKLGVRYDSDEALELAEETARKIREVARKTSEKLAEEKGPFPAFDRSTLKTERRNATLMTCAPTGTTSMIAGTTYSIEPIHELQEKKRVMDGDKVENINPTVREILDDGNPDNLLVTAKDISPEDHIEMQASWQREVDSAISKTINLPEDAEPEDVKEAITLGWEKNVKGLTLYRKRSRTGQPIVSEEEEESTPMGEKVEERPRVLPGRTYRIKLGCGRTMYTNLTHDKGDLKELFIRVGAMGGCLGANLEALGRVVSIYLRSGGDPKQIVETLKGVRCPEPMIGRGYSCPDILAKLIEENIDGNVDVEFQGDAPSCPDCGGKIIRTEGCAHCTRCGWKKC